MNRLAVSAAIAAVALVLTACPADPDEPPTPEPAETPTPEEVAVCLQGEPFVADGPAPVEATPEGDARAVSDLRWAAHEGCERFVIDLVGENGEPAHAAGAVIAEVLRDLGVVRVALPDVEEAGEDAADASFDGPLARAAYVVRDPDEGVFVDVHIGDEAEAHVAVLDDPARVVVDLRPGGGAIPAPAATEGNFVVVLDPRDGAEESYPLTITGYARTFEATVVVRLEQNGDDVYEDFTTATAWLEAWGYYELTIDDAPTGPLVVHVGEYSAADGTWEGAEVRVTVR